MNKAVGYSSHVMNLLLLNTAHDNKNNWQILSSPSRKLLNHFKYRSCLTDRTCLFVARAISGGVSCFLKPSCQMVAVKRWPLISTHFCQRVTQSRVTQSQVAVREALTDPGHCLLLGTAKKRHWISEEASEEHTGTLQTCRDWGTSGVKWEERDEELTTGPRNPLGPGRPGGPLSP